MCKNEEKQTYKVEQTGLHLTQLLHSRYVALLALWAEKNATTGAKNVLFIFVCLFDILLPITPQAVIVEDITKINSYCPDSKTVINRFHICIKKTGQPIEGSQSMV